MLCMMYIAINMINGLVALPTSHLHKWSGGQHNFKYIRTDTNQYRNFFYPRTIKDWNKLAESLKATPNLIAFKLSFKSALWA